MAAKSQGELVQYSPSAEAVSTCAVPRTKMTSCPVFGREDRKTILITFIAAEGSTGHVYKAKTNRPGIRRHECEV